MIFFFLLAWVCPILSQLADSHLHHGLIFKVLDFIYAFIEEMILFYTLRNSSVMFLLDGCWPRTHLCPVALFLHRVRSFAFLCLSCGRIGLQLDSFSFSLLFQKACEQATLPSFLKCIVYIVFPKDMWQKCCIWCENTLLEVGGALRLFPNQLWCSFRVSDTCLE